MILTCPNCRSRFKVKPEALGAQGRTVKCAKCAHKWFASPDDGEEGGAPKSAAPKKPPAPKAGPKKAAPKKAPTKQETAAKPKPAPAAEVDEDEFEPPAFADGGKYGPGSETADDAFEPPPPPPGRERSAGYDEPPLGPDEEIVPRQRQPKTVKKSPLGAWIFLLVLVVGVCVGGFFFRHDIVKAYRPANAIFSAIGFPVDTLGFGLELPAPKSQAIIDGDQRTLRITGEIRNTTAEPIDAPLLRGALRNAQGDDLTVWTFEAAEERILPGETVSYETEVENPPRGATGLFVTFTRADEVEGAAPEMEGGGEDGGGEGGGGAQQDGG
ncbi:MAG: zinc-ribbon domain-containing protein [Marivibrio sp.]|uniref:MJ0042-type zinc finger domain-containing protein n=1 Tax=Marivibrio sp. TaxID=2039719 RepID=UPI0032EB8978